MISPVQNRLQRSRAAERVSIAFGWDLADGCGIGWWNARPSRTQPAQRAYGPLKIEFKSITYQSFATIKEFTCRLRSVEPGALVVLSWHGEGGARELFAIQAIWALLRIVLAVGRQSVGVAGGSAAELVAKSGQIVELKNVLEPYYLA